MNATAGTLLAAYQCASPHAALSSMIRVMEEDYGLGHETACGEAARVLGMWRQAGLLSSSKRTDAQPSHAEPWVLPPPSATEQGPDALCLTLGGCHFRLFIENDALRADLLPLLCHLTEGGAPRAAHALHLIGEPSEWELQLNGQGSSVGTTGDDAVVDLLTSLIDLACRAEERLLVVHGAGLAGPDGRGLLLIAPGGSGKTTLAAALNASGYVLLSDDVVPVSMDGGLVALGGPICMKPGSWPVLAPFRRDLEHCRVVRRFGGNVRFLPPLAPAPSELLDLGLMLFPRYAPGEPPSCLPLAPETVLQRIIEAEAVIRNLTQDKLDRLTQWVCSAPAFAISYPDLDTALLQVSALLEENRRRMGSAA